MKFLQWKSGVLVASLILAACGGAPAVSSEVQDVARAHVAKGKALFEEKCRTVAGEKIYRKVENVEGIVLFKVRPARGDKELSDRMWPGAAFAIEAFGDSYITSFLGYEHAPGEGLSGKPSKITAQSRGYINTDRRPGSLPGYRYVDVIDEKDGKRYRITGSFKEVTRVLSKRIGENPKPTKIVDYVLDKIPATDPFPRYGVTFEDHVIPEERMLGLASSTVKVLDLQTGEVLGEMIRYAWSPSGPSRSNPVPWLTAWKCPGHAVGSDAATRKFVDQILIPAKEK
ncbi:MAG: hypothetical protein IPG33_13490 [Betaproteobacteria bacterium]|nr:hypothetical protein [Betaproteobacteria bacterium]